MVFGVGLNVVRKWVRGLSEEVIRPNGFREFGLMVRGLNEYGLRWV